MPHVLNFQKLTPHHQITEAGELFMSSTSTICPIGVDNSFEME